MVSNAKDVLTPEEAAEILRTSATTVRRLCKASKLPAIDIGAGGRHIWRLPRAAMTRHIQAASAPSKPAPFHEIE